MKIKINQDLCVGCGRCTELCPKSFKLGENGKSEVISDEDLNCAMEAADNCPVGAIEVEE